MEVAQPIWLLDCLKKGYVSAKNARLAIGGFEKITFFGSTNIQFENF